MRQPSSGNVNGFQACTGLGFTWSVLIGCSCCHVTSAAGGQKQSQQAPLSFHAKAEPKMSQQSVNTSIVPPRRRQPPTVCSCVFFDFEPKRSSFTRFSISCWRFCSRLAFVCESNTFLFVSWCVYATAGLEFSNNPVIAVKFQKCLN